jgi:UrcA family protein
MTFFIAAGAGAIAMSSAATTAGGQPSKEPITVQAYQRVVNYGDLALNTRHGRRVLIHRVGLAVHEVCPELDETGHAYDVMDCREFAWAGARPQIRQALDQARSGQPLAMSIVISSSGAR